MNAGASGAVFGLLGVLYVELFQFWQIVDRAWLELIKLTVFVVFLLAVGTLPYVDNMAHIGKTPSVACVRALPILFHRWSVVWCASSDYICSVHHLWEVGCSSQEDFAGGVCPIAICDVLGWFPDLLPDPHSRLLQLLPLHQLCPLQFEPLS